MKKTLILLTVLFLSGCTAVTDLIKIQNANKNTESMHVEMSVESDTDASIDLFGNSFGFVSNLNMSMSMDINQGQMHMFTTVKIMGFDFTIESYSVVEETERVVYSNFLGVWVKNEAEAEESSMSNFKFDTVEFLKALKGSFNIVDSIDVNGVTLKQMEIIVTGDKIQKIFGIDLSTQLSEEAVLKDVKIILGYDDDYIIKRVVLDLSEVVGDMTEEPVESFKVVLDVSLQNEIEEIIVPAEAKSA